MRAVVTAEENYSSESGMRRKPPLYRDDLTRARNSRRVPTDVEQKLWFRLRNRRLAGAKFRRQSPVGPYVVDFLCVDANLVVELDGGGHAEDKEITRDLQRSRELEKLGLRVLRFWNSDVLENLDAVLTTIAEAVESPHPTLSHGERETANG
ncbi:MAG TPA: endonuclease domain-containing protein [Thermoanaerobaculia bacterium]|nr:endonuclease domain-containing protein [Thermoanaerobaculia bacterium]